MATVAGEPSSVGPTAPEAPPWEAGMQPPPGPLPPEPPAATQPGAPAPARPRLQRLLMAAALALPGVIAAVVLAVLLLSTHAQLDKLTRSDAATQTRLRATQSQVSRVNQELTTLQSVNGYLKTFLSDDSQLLHDQARMEQDCTKTGAQCATDLTTIQLDIQKFQDDRNNASVPPQLQAADSALEGALNQYISGFELLSTAQNSSDIAAAGTKLRAADSAFADAVSQLAAALGAESANE